MGVEYKKCTIIRDVASSTGGIPGIDYNDEDTSSKLIIIENYRVKIKDYTGSNVITGEAGITYNVGTKAYGLYHSDKVKPGDKIVVNEDNRTFRIKSYPVKGISYSVMDIIEI